MIYPGKKPNKPWTLDGKIKFWAGLCLNDTNQLGNSSILPSYELRAERSVDQFIASNQAEKDEEIYLSPKIEIKKEKAGKYNPAVKPLFKTSRERYEYLMEHGCTCNDDRIWLKAYKESKEFKEYETKIRTD